MLLNDEIKKLFVILQKNGFNPNSLFDKSNKEETIAEAFHRIKREEEAAKNAPLKKYKIYCHNRRNKKISYIEDKYSQGEICNLTEGEILDYLGKNKNTIYCCYDTLANRIGHHIAYGSLDRTQFSIIYYDKIRDERGNIKIQECTSSYDRSGYIQHWPIGYFSANFLPKEK